VTLTWYFTVRVPGTATMHTGHSTVGREPIMDTERDMTIGTDEDHIVRGLD
jgi:hypothetical protein